MSAAVVSKAAVPGSPAVSLAGKASCQKEKASASRRIAGTSTIASEALSAKPPAVPPQLVVMPKRLHCDTLMSPIRIESGMPLGLIVLTMSEPIPSQEKSPQPLVGRKNGPELVIRGSPHIRVPSDCAAGYDWRMSCHACPVLIVPKRPA